MSNPLANKNFRRLMTNELKEVFNGEYKGLPMIKDTFFDVIKDKGAWHEFFSLGAVPDPELFQGIVQYQSVAPGFHTKVEPLEYAGGIVIQRLLLETDRYNEIKQKTKSLATAAGRKQNKIAHEPFMHHDSSAFTFMTNEEGVALCSNSHKTKASGVSTSTGFDNLSTLPFDATNLWTLYIQSRGLRSDIGERIDTNFDTIVYPSSLGESVWEVIKSEGKVDSMENNANWHKGRWKPLSCRILTITTRTIGLSLIPVP
jgi:hypothetical protein